jgi:hypothetical protein
LLKVVVYGAAIEKLFYEPVRFLGRSGKAAFGNCFIDGTMPEASANRHTAVWRKNLDRYEKGQKEKVLRIIRAINGNGVRLQKRTGRWRYEEPRSKLLGIFVG